MTHLIHFRVQQKVFHQSVEWLLTVVSWFAGIEQILFWAAGTVMYFDLV